MAGFITSRMGMGLAVAAAGMLMTGCATFEESGLPGSAASMARNQMMWVRKEPPSFGYYRLSSLSRIYPELGIFVDRRGLPDFLAETTNRGQHYYILYYLERRQAYACRNRAGRSGTMEFAGPYPVTDKEYWTLDGFRKKESP